MKCSACGRTEGPCPLHRTDCPLHGPAVTGYCATGWAIRALFLLFLAGCATAPTVEQPELLLRPICRGDQINILQVEAEAAGTWNIPVEVLRRAACKGAA